MLWRLLMSVFAVFLWMQREITCERNVNDCTFHYWQVSWKAAVETCEEENSKLLCYKSKKEIDDITHAFKLSAIGSAKLSLWLSGRDCSNGTELQPCLSLHIQSMKSEEPWHFFQESCDAFYPFICCVDVDVETITSSTSSTSPFNVSSDTFDSSLMTTTHTASSSRSPFCPKVSRRGINWPDTDAGTTVSRPCPGDSIGVARWVCEPGNPAKWKSSGPDLTECRSREIQDLKERFNSSSASDVISDLEHIFQDQKKEVFGKDLADIITLMADLPDRLFLEMDFLASSNKWTSTKRSVDKITSVVDRMIGLEDTWHDIDKKRKSSIGTHLLSTVDGMGSLLADSMPENKNEQNIIGRNLVLQVLRPDLGESVSLPKWLITNSCSHQGRVMLEKGYKDQLVKDEGNVTLVFALYCNMSSVLSPSHDEKEDGTNVLNSAVVSTIVNQGRKSLRINDNVRIVMEHLTENPNRSVCVFWNMDKNSWDTAGCRLESSNETYSVCVCDHLTNFALLMDYKNVLSDTDQDPFHYITLVGCSLSIICLAICVVIFSCYSYYSRHSWGLRYVIHRNLCLTLLIANLVLIIGLDKTENQRVCAVIAGCLHYFFLSAFSWMFLEAVHIYLLLVVVFASRKSHSEKYYLFGYGFPFVIVTITALSRPEHYGRKDVCWLSAEKGTIWGFMGPVASILILNTAALLLAQYKASRISVKDDKAALIKRWLRVTVILFPILGITWVFGFLYLGRYFEVAGYLFAIFNSFQGVCIFVFHCLLDKKARNMVMDSFGKKTASVHTGSSGSNRRAKEHPQNGVKSSPVTPIEDDLNRKNTFRFLKIKDKKDWTKWNKPWSFCFDMSVSDTKKERNNTSQAVVVHWNSLREKSCA